MLIFYQALKSTEDHTPSSRLLTTILSYHHKMRSSPAVLLSGLLAELDDLEDVLQALTPLPQEALSNFLWRAQVALADYNKAAPQHGLPVYSDRRLFLRILPFLPPYLRDLFLPELRVTGRDFLPSPLLLRILHDRLPFGSMCRWRVSRHPCSLTQVSAPAPRLGSSRFLRFTRRRPP